MKITGVQRGRGNSAAGSADGGLVDKAVPVSRYFTKGLRGAIARKIFVARLISFLEEFVCESVPLLVLICAYAGSALLGVWALLPFWLSIVLLVLVGLAGIWSALPLLSLRFPSYGAGMARMEAASGLSHRPLLALEDQLDARVLDPTAAKLWQLHQERVRRKLASLRIGGLKLDLHRRDPYALRTLAVMLLAVGLVAAPGGSWLPNTPQGSATPMRLDAWVTPPAYTGLAPIYLSGDAAQLRGVRGKITVPEGSELVVQVRADRRTELHSRVSGDDWREHETQNTAGDLEQNWKLDLHESIEVRVDARRDKHIWVFDVEQDRAPLITLLEEPEAQLSGSWELRYHVKDDFGVVSAHAMTKLHRPQNEGAVALVEAPRFALPLPASDKRVGEAKTLQDLSAHPFAGEAVDLVLSAQDQQGQIGVSKVATVRLPTRQFANPIARAVVEQRRYLALDARRHVEVVHGMDALLTGAARFFDNAGHYLAFRYTYRKLARARSPEELRAQLDSMWQLALLLDGGAVANAQEAVRAAQKALQKALENGASNEEIAELMDELRAAMDEYMQALAQQLHEQGQASPPMAADAMNSMSSEELDAMMERMEALAQMGNHEAARELLAQMQKMLDNMPSQSASAANQQQQEMMRALNELSDVIQEQQNLMERTFPHDEGGERDFTLPDWLKNNQQPPSADNEQRAPTDEEANELSELQQEQDELATTLQELLENMARLGAPENEQLQGAQEHMEGAEEALGQERAGMALNQQGRALQSLQQGAQQLMEQMAQQGNGMGVSRNSQLSRDPLGRVRRNLGPEFGDEVRVPDEIDVQAARRILQELRRRLSERERPRLELEYLERLLEGRP
ncbi:TIGR02302 family protein [Polycladidibacter hongkongensis]|uniref:TIGR02302 family protein n=1 Tax=Polycladidibacter hongkongensis TaxID=1647556 RepID=UPI0008331E51|nr:TIGR02302 family protein [Pseudovibrio hongkongensis]